jgi:hypothetical protein
MSVSCFTAMAWAFVILVILERSSDHPLGCDADWDTFDA